jgi:hypothetical protein
MQTHRVMTNKIKLISRALTLLGMCLANIGIVSCVGLSVGSQTMPDPVYMQDYKNIEDADYSATKIVGGWMQVGGQKNIKDGIVTSTEERRYLYFEPDGTGIQVSRIVYQDEAIPTESEVKFLWRYEGYNRWMLTLHFETGTIISTTPGYWQKLKNSGPNTVEFRYHDGRLYPKGVPNTYVRMTEDAVKSQLARIRAILR